MLNQDLHRNCRRTLLLAALFFPPALPAQDLTSARHVESRPIFTQREAGRKALPDLLKELEQTYKVRFSFEDKLLEGLEVGTSIERFSGSRFDQALEYLLSPLNLSYKKLRKDFYVIQARPEGSAHGRLKRSSARLQTGQSHRAAFLYPAAIGALPIAEVQERTVSGKVTDAETGEGLPGVSVVLKGSNAGTSTDGNGNFELGVPMEGESRLVFSLMGFVSQERAAGEGPMAVALVRDIAALDEVVVVGYGAVRRSDLTGSVASVKAEEFNKGVNTSVEQLIQGKVAGARIVSNSGEPGGGLSISIRGASSINAGTEPLFVIDGLPVSYSSTITGTGEGFPGTPSPRSPLNVLNPSDIESIEVLKDASATAIYGARGANGVILITTKSGSEGKATVSYEGYLGVQNAANKLDMLGPQEYQSVINSIIEAGGGNAEQRVGEIAGEGTDWQKEVYNKDAIVHNHNISISGGTKASRYFASFNHQDQDGVVGRSSFRKYGARFNLDSDISDKLSLALNFTAAYTRDDFAPVGYAINENGGLLYTAIYFDPTLPVFDGNGNYFISPDLTIENPLALLEGMTAYANNYTMLGTVSGEYKFSPEFSVKITAGGDANDQRRDSYVSKVTQRGLAYGGIASILEGQQSNYLLEASGTYQKSVGEHQFNVFAGATTQKFTTVRSSQFANSFAADVTGTDNIGLGNQQTFDMGSNKFNNKLISFIGRVNYGWKDKYLLTATFRADGSSKFGDNNKFGYFPSLAAAWKISGEDFLSGSSWLSNLKLRASWGRTGNQSIGNYQSITTLGPGFPAIFNDSEEVSLSPERIGNPDLKWESTEQWNVGLDFGLINGRLSGSIDYYRKSTSDMLLALPIPLETGFPTLMSNVGRIDNSGLDLMLNSVNVSSGRFSWTTSLNFSTLKNEVKDLGGVPQIITGSAGFTNQIFVIREGAPLYSFYGHQIDGVWQQGDDFSVTTDNVQPGDLKYRDINGDGTVNADDRVILGDGFPDFTLALGNTLNYKNLSLDIFFEGVQGVEMLNNNLVDTYFPIQLRRNKLAEPYLNRWTPENPSDKYPSFITPLGQGRKAVNSYTVEDASFIRLRTVRLNYSFPAVFNNAIRNLTIYLTADNLATFSNYSGMDPAVNSNGTANSNIDFNTYPLARTFMAGLKIDF